MPTLLPPVPTLPPLVPTPPPLPTPRIPPDPIVPGGTPTPGASEGPAASIAPSPAGSSAPSVAPAGPVGPGGGGPDTSGGASVANEPAPISALQFAGVSGDELRVTLGRIGGLGLPVEWLVPSLVVSVPGILLILAVLAQGAGALLWLPYVRRTLGGDRRRRRTGTMAP